MVELVYKFDEKSYHDCLNAVTGELSILSVNKTNSGGVSTLAGSTRKGNRLKGSAFPCDCSVVDR